MQSVLADSRRRDEKATSHTASEGDANRKRARGQIRVSGVAMVEERALRWGTGELHSQWAETGDRFPLLLGEGAGVRGTHASMPWVSRPAPGGAANQMTGAELWRGGVGARVASCLPSPLTPALSQRERGIEAEGETERERETEGGRGRTIATTRPSCCPFPLGDG